MSLPHVQGLQVLELLDYGGCGRVYGAVAEDGEWLALKCLDDLSVNRALLHKMTERLLHDGWPDGVMPVISGQSQRSPLYQLKPLVADEEGVGWVPRTLQHRFERYPKEDPWPLIVSLAAALAAMHKRHVPHGNLKPGNIFFDAAGGVMLTDWCLGNMPGVHVFHFTDALLYQPPEQLLDNSGYHDEQGYGWDVFAFGVIAFRLLTGRFPRCHSVFRQVAPPQGVTRCEGLRAETEKIAVNLRNAELEEWPGEPADECERRMRAWIGRCLEIDPAQRPLTMIEVDAGFRLIRREVEAQQERLQLEATQRVLRRRVSALVTGLVVVAVAFLAAVFLWRSALGRMDKQRAEFDGERQELRADANAARAERAVAVRDVEEARRVLDEEKRVLEEEREAQRSRLEASRMLGDQLFAWAMENGRRRLPSLEGRALRLQRLESYHEDFIKHAESDPELAEELARARLQLAEISIAAGDHRKAMERLGPAMVAVAGLPKDAGWMLRLASDRLLLAMLSETAGDAQALKEYAEARKALEAVPREEADADRLDQLAAVIDFREAKLLMRVGDERKSLEQLMRATQSLNRLSANRPDVTLLRSALAECYLSSAVVLDGMGNLGDAREVRQLALVVLTRLHEEKPADLDILFELAACYGAMAEAALSSGDVDAARQRSEQAVQWFTAYLKQRPRDDEATIRKASMFGLQAELNRDQGKGVEAAAISDEAVRLLESVHDRTPGQASATYHLGLIWWQKGRAVETKAGSGDLALLSRANLLFEQLAKERPEGGPVPEQLDRSRAYLAGDLAFAYSSRGQKDKAAAAYRDAIRLWEGLLKLRPQNEEYQHGLEWCRDGAGQPR